MEGNISLCDSQICRLCAEPNSNGYALFQVENDIGNLTDQINKYLPVEVTDDGKYPRWICPGCHLQLESTIQFFTLVETGQTILTETFIQQEENERLNDQIEVINPNVIENDDDELDESTGWEECFEEIQEVDPCQVVEKIIEMERRASSMRPADAEPLLVKKKRGRPPKAKVDLANTIEMPVKTKSEEEQNVKEDPTGIVMTMTRSKRQIKPPARYQETQLGKDLSSKSEKLSTEDLKNIKDEFQDVIAHVQDPCGSNIGDVITVCNAERKVRFQKLRTRFVCEVCKEVFARESNFLEHSFSHKNIRYECTECNQNFVLRVLLEQHQKLADHTGMGVIENFVEESIDESKETQSTEIMKTENCEINIIVGSNGEITNIVPTTLIQSTAETFTGEPFGEDNFSNINMEEQAAKVLKELQSSASNPILSQDSYEPIEPNFFNIPDEPDPDDPLPLDAINAPETGSNTNLPKFVCSKCPKAFATKEKIQRHQLVHSENRPYECDKCNSTFKSKINLQNHEATHSIDRKYHCNECGHTFAMKQCLAIHMRIHSGQKPYKCDICSKSFRQRGNMLEHKRIHTGERPFQCKECGARFKTSSQCRNHKSRHTGRSIPCPRCDKLFFHPSELKVHHQRRHSKLKPYFCKDCGKGFPDPTALSKHARIHTGEKPYACQQCKRQFADCSNYRKHLRVHEKRKLSADVEFKSIFDLVDQNLSDDNMSMSSMSEREPVVMTPPPPLELTTTTTTGRSILDDDDMGEFSAAVDSAANVWNMIDGNFRSRALPDSNGVTGNDATNVVCISYPDPLNPVDNKTTTFYIME